VSGEAAREQLPLLNLSAVGHAKLKHGAVSSEVKRVQGGGVIHVPATREFIEAEQANNAVLQFHRHHSLPNAVRYREVEFIGPATRLARLPHDATAVQFRSPDERGLVGFGSRDFFVSASCGFGGVFRKWSTTF
jgi:hypothetical protein